MSTFAQSAPRAVLFDLDGTLADTAPDLAAAVNKLRTDRGLAPAPYETLRPLASHGARGLIGAAFGISPSHDEYEPLRLAFLDNYTAAIADKSTLFDDVEALLGQLRLKSIQWGVVTNKAARLTDLLIPLIGLGHAACVISGDTTPHPKPHPAPLLEAARRIGLDAAHCWYVGDDLRDMQAAKAAGMFAIAAAWGYCGDSDPTTWEADCIIDSPLGIIELIAQSVRD